MRIVHLGKFYPPNRGGIESVTEVLARRQAQAGHSVEVLCFTHGAARTETIDGVLVRRCAVHWVPGSQPLAAGYVRAALRLARQAQLLHVHVPNVLASLLLPLIGRGPRVALHWHSDIVDKGMLGALVRPVEHAALHRADVVIATSDAYVAHSLPLQSVRHKVRVVPLGIESLPAETRDTAIPAALRTFLGERKLLLGLGRLVPYKGFHHLIEAAAQLPDDAAVIIVGDGPLRESLQRQIDASGLRPRVHLAGRVTNDELAALLRSARVFCMPSTKRSEAFGVALLDALAHGLPCVATRIPGSGTAWVNEHEVSGLNVPPEDAQALAVACTRILRDDDFCARLGHGARTRFQQRFTAERFVDEIHKAYGAATP